MTNTNTAKAFSTLAPFEIGTGDYSVLKSQTVTGTGGMSIHQPADTNSTVMCLTCHRAHATAFEHKIRWNYAGNEFMTAADSVGAAIYDTVNGKGTGYNALQQQNAYYGRPATVFGANARSYCNKCHAKD